MFGIGGSELIVIFIIALVVLGPDKLPEIARAIGKVFGELQKATDDLKHEMDLAATMKENPKQQGDKPSENPPAPAQEQQPTFEWPEDTEKKTE